MYNQKFGKIGENIACKYLSQKGFKIIETNFYTKWGEIDIVAYKDDHWHFVEVKTRATTKYGRPEEAITYRKLQRTRRAVIIYLNQHHLKKAIYQIDALSILHNFSTNQATVRFFPNISFY